MTNVVYIVGKKGLVFHSKEEKFYAEGETINLSHLNASQIAAVLSTGAIEEAKPPKKEVSNGKTDPN